MTNPERPDFTTVFAALQGKALPVTVDTPLSFRYDARSRTLLVEAQSLPLLGSYLWTVQLEISPAASESLRLVLQAIEANPGKDISGTATGAIVQ